MLHQRVAVLGPRAVYRSHTISRKSHFGHTLKILVSFSAPALIFPHLDHHSMYEGALFYLCAIQFTIYTRQREASWSHFHSKWKFCGAPEIWNLSSDVKPVKYSIDLVFLSGQTDNLQVLFSSPSVAHEDTASRLEDLDGKNIGCNKSGKVYQHGKPCIHVQGYTWTSRLCMKS